MTEIPHEWPVDDAQASIERLPSEAPPLPIEGHIVATTLTAARMQQITEQMLLVLRYAPRDAATFARLHNEALTAWCEMDEHYSAYQAVLECKGQG